MTYAQPELVAVGTVPEIVLGNSPLGSELNIHTNTKEDGAVLGLDD
jgi:hypothetical protein